MSDYPPSHPSWTTAVALFGVPVVAVAAWLLLLTYLAKYRP